MSKILRSWQAEQIRKNCPKETRVTLAFIDGPYTDLMLGERGTITVADDAGMIFINWDTGSSLVVFPDTNERGVPKHISID